jgi:hypothetical protein
MGLIDELETCRTPGDRPRPSSRATHADNHDAVAGDRAWLRRTIPHRRRPHRQVIPPSRSAKPLRQVTPPSRSARSLRQVTPPSHSAKSLRQVAPPSRSAKSLRQVALPRGEGGQRPGEGPRGRWQRQGKTAVESGRAIPSKSDSPRSEPVGLVLPAQAEGLGFGPQIAPAL